MFGLFKKSKVIRKSDDQSNKTETKWFKGQKVKIKTGTTSSRPNKKNYRGNKSNRSNNQTWFKEAPLPVPNVEKGQISFPGRYLVLIPNSNTKGISRRLPEQERSRLDRIIRKIKPEGFGVIVRTAAEGVSENSLKNDIDKLVEEWSTLKKLHQS